MNSISYTISLEYLNQHLLAVECLIPKPSLTGQRIAVAAWIPGSYLVRDLAKHVVNLKAYNDDMEIAVLKIDKNSWICSPCVGPLRIKYLIYCFDLAPRAAYVDNSRVFFDGARVFLDVLGAEEQDFRVTIAKPEQALAKHWVCVSSMHALEVDRQGYGTYIASNHLELIDHPFVIGPVQQFEFMVSNVPHYLVVLSDIPADYKRLIQDMTTICQYQVQLFGELPPMDKYVFILNVLSKGYGGIEHRNSSSLLCAINNLPILGETDNTVEYQSLLGLISHEYFHLWNVKRIKPEVFVNMNLYHEAYTTQLWIFEGITSYYDNLVLVRSGVISHRDYLKMLQKDIDMLQQTPGSLQQNLLEASFDAWIKFYQPDENTINASVSYYLKGSLVALLLDLQIMRMTHGHYSLVDVMQELWHKYGKIGLGLPERHFEKIVQELIEHDLSEFFTMALGSTTPLDFAAAFTVVGIQYTSKPLELLDSLGIKLLAEPSKLQVRAVLNNSAAEDAGLAPNDIIIAVNNLAVSLSNLADTINRFQTACNGVAILHVFRNDVLLTLELHEPMHILTACQLDFAENTTPEQRKHLNKWLG